MQNWQECLWQICLFLTQLKCVSTFYWRWHWLHDDEYTATTIWPEEMLWLIKCKLQLYIRSISIVRLILFVTFVRNNASLLTLGKCIKGTYAFIRSNIKSSRWKLDSFNCVTFLWVRSQPSSYTEWIGQNVSVCMCVWLWVNKQFQ